MRSEQLATSLLGIFLALVLASQSSATELTFDVEESASWVAFEVGYSFLLVVGTSFLGSFESQQVELLGASVLVGGTIDSLIEGASTSINVTSLDVDTDSSIIGSGREDLDMNVESINLDLAVRTQLRRRSPVSS